MGKHTVAVYGSLRQGLGNHRLLMHVPKFKQGWTMTDFTMYSLGGFPAIVPDKAGKPVVVEVYEVDDATFARLDMLEGYHDEEHYWYNRKQVPVRLDTGEDVQAWIYFFDSSAGVRSTSDVVVHGDWSVFVKEQYK